MCPAGEDEGTAQLQQKEVEKGEAGQTGGAGTWTGALEEVLDVFWAPPSARVKKLAPRERERLGWEMLSINHRSRGTSVPTTFSRPWQE